MLQEAAVAEGESRKQDTSYISRAEKRCLAYKNKNTPHKDLPPPPIFFLFFIFPSHIFLRPSLPPPLSGISIPGSHPSR